MSKTISAAVLDVLASADVRHIFGIPGDAINGLVDAIRDQEAIDFVKVRHEEAGAFAASAQAKLTGRLGVCIGTAGPGSVHLMNGLYDAKLDSAPVLAITGQVETKYLGSHYHQEVDQSSLFEDVADFSETIVNPDQVPGVVSQAVRSAMENGSVSHLSLPADLATAEIDQTDHTPYLHREPRTVPCDEDLDAAAELINTSSNVTILAGIGAAGAVGELLEIADILEAPIIKTLRAKDLLPDDHPMTVGGLGLLGTRAAVKTIGRTDLLLMVGTDFPYEDFYPDEAKCVQVDIDSRHIGRRYPVDVGLVGHAELALASLADRLEPREDGDHLAMAQSDMSDWIDTLQEAERDDDTPLRPQRVAAELGRLAPDDSIFVADTGSVTVWAARHLRLAEGGRFTLSSSLASMAYALPAAIGAQLSYPDRSVVALAGDGGFSMLMGDFITAVTEGLPITVVVFNNSKLGLIQMEQEAEGFAEYGTGLDNPNFAEFARVLGGEGWRVDGPEELAPALSAALSSEKPAVVDVVVNPNEVTVPPSLDPEFAVGYALAKIKEMAGLGRREGGLDPLEDLIPVATDRI